MLLERVEESKRNWEEYPSEFQASKKGARTHSGAPDPEEHAEDTTGHLGTSARGRGIEPSGGTRNQGTGRKDPSA